MPDHLELFGFKPEKGREDEEIAYRIVILHNIFFTHISQMLKSHQLTPAKMNVLMIIKHQGGQHGLRQIDLSKRLMVTTSNMTRVLSKLLRDNLISIGNSDDRRVKLIKITPKASKMLDLVWPEYTTCLKVLTQSLSKRQQNELLLTLRVWMNSLQQK